MTDSITATLPQWWKLNNHIDWTDTRHGSFTLGYEPTLRQLEIQRTKTGFQVLADADPDVGPATLNPYWEVIRRVPCTRDYWYWSEKWSVDCFDSNEMRWPSRRALVRMFAWSIPSPADLAWLTEVLDGRGVVDVGAGSGYWAWQLTQVGVDVVAVDEEPWKQLWFPVEVGNTYTAAEHPDRALMLIWPPYGSPMARAALDFYKGDLLIYAGEDAGGCTADDDFFVELERNWESIGGSEGHATYGGIHCQLKAYRRVSKERCAPITDNEVPF